jgi:hypothetical protein
MPMFMPRRLMSARGARRQQSERAFAMAALPRYYMALRKEPMPLSPALSFLLWLC